MEQPITIGIDLAKNVFQGPSGNDRSSGSIVAKDAWARAGGSSCGERCGGRRCWCSSAACRPALSAWRVASGCATGSSNRWRRGGASLGAQARRARP